MNGKVHTFIGTVSLFAVMTKFGTSMHIGSLDINTVPAILTVNIGSTLADLDLICLKLAKRKHKIAAKAATMATGGHRGITHYPIWIIPFYFLMTYVNTLLAPYPFLNKLAVGAVFGIALGWFLHVFADWFNGKGIPLAGPVSRKKHNIMDVPSEGIGAWIFAFILTAIVIAILYYLGGK